MNKRQQGEGFPAEPWHVSRPRDQARTANVYGITLSQRELCQLLVRSADEYAHETCEEHPCEVCDGFVSLWHELYQSLTAGYRFMVETALETLDLPSPYRRDGKR